mmetsp:Transcript_36685/g.59278  ORF Transcript_36685/g.59278 Transcript_36685/m.59278 type:complete len:214 (+) Transcript_36685:20-661(+)
MAFATSPVARPFDVSLRVQPLAYPLKTTHTARRVPGILAVSSCRSYAKFQQNGRPYRLFMPSFEQLYVRKRMSLHVEQFTKSYTMLKAKNSDFDPEKNVQSNGNVKNRTVFYSLGFAPLLLVNPAIVPLLRFCDQLGIDLEGILPGLWYASLAFLVFIFATDKVDSVSSEDVDYLDEESDLPPSFADRLRVVTLVTAIVFLATNTVWSMVLER